MSRSDSVCALLVVTVVGSRIASGAEIAPEMRRELNLHGAIRVIVELDEATPPPRSRLQETRGRTEAQDRVVARLPAGCALRHRYRYSPALALMITSEEALEAVASLPEVARISPDIEGRGALLESRALVRANEVFDLGVTGEGRVVAILDTGVDTDHPDLAGTVVHAYHFFGIGDTGPGAEDDHGHGTHVAGIIASRGVRSPRGLAPASEIVAIKVLSESNRGFLTDWAAGVEHVIGLHDDGLRIDVINMSLVSDALYPGICDGSVLVFRNACEAAKGRGILLVASSGDTGSADGIRSPACYSAVVAIGSASETPPEAISAFTDRSGLVDLLAPGETITSAGLGGGAVTVSGTSQAAAHVSGVALLLRQIAPDLDPDGVLEVLESTGVPIGDAATGLSFPRIDALQAVTELAGVEDCDGNGRPDRLELVLGTASDLNRNGVPDACEGPRYLRGDANADGEVNLSDPISIFGSLFGGDPEVPCERAADAGADGQVNIADSIYLLNFLVAAGEAPAAPYPDCGLDPDEKSPLGCAAHPPCAR